MAATVAATRDDAAAAAAAAERAARHAELEAGRTARTLSAASIAKSLLAGGVAGGVSRTAVAPLERLKILMQVQGSEKIYTGVWQGLKHMVRTEGVAGCFKGNWTNCVRIIPNSAVKFLLYEQLSRSLSHRAIDAGGDGRLTPGLRLAAGAAAGIVAMSATYPLDMVRGRLTVQGGDGLAKSGGGGSGGGGGNAASSSSQPYRGIVHAARCIVRDEGLVALWRGWLPSVIGVVPYVGLNFAVYETAKDATLRVRGLRDERDLSVATRLACGAVAGTTGQTVAYPLDVVRRRMQMSGWAGARGLHHTDAGAAVVYTGMVDCFRRTVAEEGVSALFKGLWPNYVKVVPSIAIAFVTYEQLKEAMGVQLRISS